MLTSNLGIKMSAVTESVKPSVETSVEETRTGLCEEFASITGSDSAVAQCYLAENEWEMEVHLL